MLIGNNELIAIRILQKGLINVHQEVVSSEETYATTLHLENDTIKQAFDNILHDIMLTVENFMSKMPTTPTLEKIVLSGATVDIKGMQEYINTYFKVPCELLTTNRVLHIGNMNSKNSINN